MCHLTNVLLHCAMWLFLALFVIVSSLFIGAQRFFSARSSRSIRCSLSLSHGSFTRRSAYQHIRDLDVRFYMKYYNGGQDSLSSPARTQLSLCHILEGNRGGISIDVACVHVACADTGNVDWETRCLSSGFSLR